MVYSGCDVERPVIVIFISQVLGSRSYGHYPRTPLVMQRRTVSNRTLYIFGGVGEGGPFGLGFGDMNFGKFFQIGAFWPKIWQKYVRGT